MSAAATAASLQAPTPSSSSVVREVGKLEAVARGVGGVKLEPSSSVHVSNSVQQATRTTTAAGGAGAHSAPNCMALSQLPPVGGANPLQCLQQMTVIGPDVKPDMSAGSQKLCSTNAANSNAYQLGGLPEQWAAAFTQLGGNSSGGYFNGTFNVPSMSFNYPALAAGHTPFIDPSTGRITGAWPADLDPAKKGKGRQTYNRSQTHTLENTFQQNRYVTRKMRAELERQTGLTDRQIKIWFQNRRMKAKKDGHRLADEQDPQQQPPNTNGSCSQQPLIAHPPTPTSNQPNALKSTEVRANAARNDAANLRHCNLTPPLSRGAEQSSTFGGYNCHFPGAYPNFTGFPGQFAAMETDMTTARPHKGGSFSNSGASSMPASSGQMWGQGCFDAWQMAGMMDHGAALSMLHQQSLAALSTPIGGYNGGGGSFQTPNLSQACAPSGNTSTNPAGYHQYTANENR